MGDSEAGSAEALLHTRRPPRPNPEEASRARAQAAGDSVWLPVAESGRCYSHPLLLMQK